RAVDKLAILLALVQDAAEDPHRTPQVRRLHGVVVQLPGFALRTGLGRGGKADGPVAHAAVHRAGIDDRRQQAGDGCTGDGGPDLHAAVHGGDAARRDQASISTPSATIRYSTDAAGMPLPLSLLKCSTCSGVSSLRSSTPCTTALPVVSLGM